MNSFPELKQYALFLLENHLETFTSANIESAKQYNLPANNIIFNWAEEEYYSFIKDRTKTFLSFFLDKDPLERSIIELVKWKKDRLPKVTGRILNIEDLTLSYNIRKEILIKLLPCYTQDIYKNNNILLEFEGFYREWQKAAFKVLFELQNENLLRQIQERTSEISQKNKELEKINNDLDNFIYTASHDLKAPVSNIEGLILALKENLSDESKKEDQYELIELIEKSIYRFKGTIQDLTDISKVQRNMANDEIEVINISEILEDVKGLIADQILSCEAKIILEIEHTATIQFSKVNLKSIFYNLICNAIKYKSQERTPLIKIICKTLDDQLYIEVQDNGMGIKKKNLDKIFLMFKRFHDHVEGTGIGLYIVKRIIDNSNGRIEVDSQENIGTTFKIYLNQVAIG